MTVTLLELPVDTRTQQERVIDAALRCIARWGLAKTALDDVAREAGLSRATVYRLFPGGKDGLIETIVAHEVAAFFAAVTAEMARAASLEDAIVFGMTEAWRRILDHDALQCLLAQEPEVVVPRLAFSPFDSVLLHASDAVGPHLERWMTADEARRAAEWVARLVVSYASLPADHVDVASRDSVRRLVRAFVLPGLLHNP